MLYPRLFIHFYQITVKDQINKKLKNVIFEVVFVVEIHNFFESRKDGRAAPI